ncbi:manganese superoxide dismutase [Sistotremastrum niveocremeum HHB9708]|uniref:Superoxide dismutase n=1 Tax=Sistotremastrum niveocremeum HHB9708 TaxID=1314777 RepID=A0A164X4S3_9AGAM|nr:manganese superoxide dismutase [Sistotremastrum niveocremeum HHB9708]
MVYTLPDLPYSHDALEPHITEQIMLLHHLVHHQTYVDSFNKAELSLQTLPPGPERDDAIRVKAFNEGGHINHSLFWKNLAPSHSAGHPSTTDVQQDVGGVLVDGKLKTAIVEHWGSVEQFKEEFNLTTSRIQGSGWGWLGSDRSGRLEIATTANQDPLSGSSPLIGVDIWEHAYYLKYLNDKRKYLKEIWNVINWFEAERRYAEAIAQN